MRIGLILAGWTVFAITDPAWSAPPDTPKSLTDSLGDPLPPGAVMRLGTVRLRHGHDVSSLCFSPDGKSIASAGIDGIRVWDVKTGIERGIMLSSKERPSSVLFLPDGKRLVAVTRSMSGEDCFVRVLDLESRKELFRFPGRQYSQPQVAASPDGKLLAVHESSFRISL
jgi:WD40 repeat protein